MEKKKFKFGPFLLIAGILLILAAFGPYVFGKLSGGPVFGSDTGAIGDTIGGITAPFLSLLGSILVFAALLAQVRANDIVIEQFEISELQRIKDLELRDKERQEEKDKEEEEKNEDIRNKMEMLLLDLDAIINDIQSKGDKMKEYGEHELRAPFEFKVLMRTASNAIDRVHNLDREAIYKAFKLYLDNDLDWVRKYRKLYSGLDFLKAFFPDVYSKYDEQTKEIYELKKNTAEDIDSAMTFATKNLKEFEKMVGQEEAKEHPLYQMIDKFIIEWYQFLEGDGLSIGEKLGEAKIDYFSPFIREAVKLSSEDENPINLFDLIEKLRKINLIITLIEYKSRSFGQIILDAHKVILEDEDNAKCLSSQLKELKEFIESGINTVEQ